MNVYVLLSMLSMLINPDIPKFILLTGVAENLTYVYYNLGHQKNDMIF